jgi:putative membrane protein
MMMGYGFGMGFFGIVMMIFFWGGLIAAAIWLAARLFPVNPQAGSSPSQLSMQSAQDILNVRYAKGELTEEQYRQMTNTLRQ